ncbi:unnamed protein product [Brachionus calyciflorus]|uniref:Dynamin-binding protein n=1 Tax=Brachionus calyciflorus TaxID=104777 RepID=A0A814BQV2_9BILA|nr:unnamed protein product [Brachionus calyciflorus]
MSFEFKYAQIGPTYPIPNTQLFLPGDIVQILYNLNDEESFVKNVMIEAPIFDKISNIYLTFINIPDHILYPDNNYTTLFVALCDFTQGERGDLIFRKDDLIVSEKSIDSNWLFGYNLNEQFNRGIFPITHVRKVFLFDRDVSKYVNFDIRPRQAKIVRQIKSGLRADIGDYILITGQINDYLYFGENLDLDKNFILRESFDFIDQNEPVLTHTQHYMLRQPSYCLVKFDFIPKNQSELKCSKNEKLEIIEEINPEWLNCKNLNGNIGLVPKNFVSMTESSSSNESFCSLPLYEKSSSLIEANNIRFQSELRSQSLTPDIMKTLYKVKTPPPRPPKPPKHVFEHLNISNQDKKDNLEDSAINDLLFDFLSLKAPLSSAIGNDSISNTELQTEENKKSKREKKLIERYHVLNELIETEKNYYRELQLCYDCFMKENESLNPIEFNKSSMFDKIIPILNFTKNFLESFETQLINNENDYLKCKFSTCFTSNLVQMKNIYSQYSRSHEEIVITLKKYEQNPEINEFIKNRINSIKDQLLAADLAAILIKPVQRIFKYPLFINRILDSMDDFDDEYQEFVELKKQMSELLEHINEKKRGHDLTAKYLNKPNLADGLQSQVSISKKVKTIKKLTERISLQLTNGLGWTNHRVVDENFNKIEKNYKTVEIILRNHYNNLNSYLSCLRNILDCEKDWYNDILTLAEDEFDKYYKLDLSANHRRSKQFQEYADKMMKQVLMPVKSLINNLNGPNKLISKRNDKLLDYENALDDENKNQKETKLSRTKKDYEALNNQLIEELPIFTQISTIVLLKTFQIFSLLTNNFINLINQSLKNDVETTNIDLSINYCRTTLTLRYHQLNNVFNRQTLLEPNCETISNFDSIPLSQSEQERQNVLEKYPIDKIYIVTQKYVANLALCQLNQNINDLVGLKKPYNPNGDSNIWFVYNGKTEGFVPSIVLEPYQKYYNQNNLICFDDENAQESFTSVQEERYCLAKYSLKANTPNMIDLFEGNIYRILEQSDQRGNSDWWLIESNEHGIGYAPKNYLQIIK